MKCFLNGHYSQCVGEIPTVCTYVMLLNAWGESGSVDVVSCKYVCVA